MERQFVGHEKTRRQSGFFVPTLSLVANEWHKSHKARTLGCPSEVTLPFGRELRAAAVHHTSVWVYVRIETSDVFEVNVLNVVG